MSSPRPSLDNNRNSGMIAAYGKDLKGEVTEVMDRK